MKQELVTELQGKPENIEAAFDIAAVLPSLQESLIRSNLLVPLKAWAAEKGLEFSRGQFGIFDRWFGFNFKRSGWKNISIRFEFSGHAGSFQGFQYGLWGKNPDLVERLTADGAKQDDSHILVKHDLEGYEKDWNGKVFAELSKPDNKVVKLITEKVQSLLDLLDEKAQGVAV